MYKKLPKSYPFMIQLLCNIVLSRINNDFNHCKNANFFVALNLILIIHLF
jgi:hypothetical protein